ncbi:DUF4386 domain-containing protein [Micromonospora sp. WMMA1363]|uniref:DUF4386 domain-containing protein n=1 Tax=Micromonospora sp. WMMA1363 TaxID=3053985 RepID=UPI00259C734D|nr:DUF4386 domain-containing protein [Micromonospora sp. WMMA1363]MDM4720680.1 DUF4386 domain-containing protein [Micromonospora sp. WMMA1363]
MNKTADTIDWSDPTLQTRSTATARQARLAGVGYLLVIAGGLFAEVAARGSLIVPGDAAATARAITDHETLWRWGLAVHLVYLIPAVVVNVLVSGLFRMVAPALARSALVFGVTAVTVEAVSLLHLFLPLALIEETGAVAALSDGQQQALVYLATRLFATGFAFSLVFFAGFCVLVGWLILRSRLVPRVFGVMMIVAGGCYVVNTLALILSPALADRIAPAILLPILVAELSLALRLAVRGAGQETVGR